jgi:peroxiredoxin
MVDVGQPAPDFTLKGHDGESVTLSQFKGDKYVVLSLYPAAFTGG